jgi:hypothetical protein
MVAILGTAKLIERFESLEKPVKRDTPPFDTTQG